MPEGAPRKEEGETIPAPGEYRNEEGKETVAAPDYTAVTAGQEKSKVQLEKYVKGIDDSGVRNLRDMAIDEQSLELESAMESLAAMEAEADKSPAHAHKVAEAYARVRRMETELQQMKDDLIQEKEDADNKKISEIRQKLQPPPLLDKSGENQHDTVRLPDQNPPERSALKKFWDKLSGKK